MEGPVIEIRDTFFHDLTGAYLKDQTGSLLYRTFWSENMKGLLKAHFPELLTQDPPVPEDMDRLRELMSNAMKERPEWWHGDLLLQESGPKQRRDFWEELWLNDAAYRAKLISDTEYYLWLVEYLAEHDAYYKTNIYYYDEHGESRAKRSGHTWLSILLRKGLGMDTGELKREITARRKARRKAHKKAGNGEDPSEARAENTLSRAEVEEALAMLTEQIQADPDRTARRLHNLKLEKDRKRNYLPWLTTWLKRMALHIKIKNWLQDSGYPLVGTDGPPKKGKKARKSDFTMRLFEAYCNSAEGYELRRKSDEAQTAGGTELGDWYMEEGRFCILDTDQKQLEALLAAHGAEQDDTPYLYIPLAVHLQSGCVFFLAGKEYYEDVYQKAGDELKTKYRSAKHRYCFDYLRLDKAHSEGLPRGGTFCLAPTFHDNVEKDYKNALKKFKRYCTVGTVKDRSFHAEAGRQKGPGGLDLPHTVELAKDSPFHAVRKYNGPEPDGIPGAFQWAFDV